MRIDLLTKRPLFFKQFDSALTRFLKYESSWVGNIIWQKNNFYTKSENKLNVYHKINIIASANIDYQLVLEYGREYGYHENRFRSYFQTMYVNNIFKFPFSLFTKKYSITIYPWQSILDAILIIPGNHSIRIINESNNESYIVPYYKNNFISNEISLRKHDLPLSIPGNFRTVDECDGYAEQIVKGIPINRLMDLDRKDLIISKVKEELKMLYNETQNYIAKDKYINNINDLLNNSLAEAANCIPARERESIYELSQSFMSTLKRILPDYIPMAMTHGDLQLGNILYDFDNNDYYIIDWEFCSNRMVFYDALVLLLNSRFPHQYSHRLLKFDADLNSSRYKWAFPKCENIGKWIIISFICEDLILNLQELKFTNHCSKGFLGLLNELVRYKVYNYGA